MRAVVKIIESVVNSMKPDFTGFTAAEVGTTGVYTFTEPTAGAWVAKLSDLFVGERMKMTVSGTVYRGTVTQINANNFRVNFTTSGLTATLPSVILNYHYGHLMELRNRFRGITENPTYKFEQFPAIILVQDIQEKLMDIDYRRDATLRLFILTDSKQEYSSVDRYTYTFEPILYPLEALFIKHLKLSNYIQAFDNGYTRYDRLYWGRVENAEGTATNIFNDFIDAIEIENLVIQTSNC